MKTPLLQRVESWFPPRLAALLAIVGLAATAAFHFERETPYGGIEGTVLLGEDLQPLANVELTLSPLMDDSPHDLDAGGYSGVYVRTATTDAQGRFTLNQLPAGAYQVAASTGHHTLKESRVTVHEGEIEPLSFTLERSNPNLQIGQHQRVFGTHEKTTLPLYGYVDAALPRRRDKVTLTLFRTRLSTLMLNEKGYRALETIDGWQHLSRLPQDALRPTPKTKLKAARVWTESVAAADREGFFHKRVAIPTTGPGLYLIQIEHDDDADCAWLLVSDSALIVKRADRQMLGYLVDLQSGRPRTGGTFHVFHKGKQVAEAKVNARGLAAVTLPASGGQLVAFARHGDDEAVLARTEYELEEHSQWRVHAYTDRPIYRPGQRISFKTIARQKGEGYHYKVPANEAIDVLISDPTGMAVSRQQLTTNAYGSCFGALELSPEAPTGVYTMEMALHGEKHTHDIMVAAYRKPEFTATVTPAKKHYARGEEVTVEIAAEYYFGAPVAGATVSYAIDGQPNWNAGEPDDNYDTSAEYEGSYEGEGEFSSHHYLGESEEEGTVTLDEHGKATIRFTPKAREEEGAELPPQATYTISATVNDPQHREATAEGTVDITTGDFRLNCHPNGYLGTPGQPMPVTLRATDFDGRPLANIVVELESLYWVRNVDEGDGETDARNAEGAARDAEDEAKKRGRRLWVQKGTTNANGEAVISLTPPHAGDLRLRGRAIDSGGRRVDARASLFVAAEGQTDLDTDYSDLSVLTDKRQYSSDETACVAINTARLGQTVLLTLEGDRVYDAFTVPIHSRSTIISIPLKADYGPNVELVACYVQSKHFARSEVALRVTVPQRMVQVKVEPDRPRARPGERVTYSVTTTDKAGRGVPCEFSLGVVDEAIYALQEDDPRAIVRTFYPQRYNNVSTEYSFAIEYLGDANKAEPNIATRKRFPDTAFWNAALTTDAGGHATVPVDLPDNLTTWRATVVAHTMDTALGYSTGSIVSTKEFLVRLEKPRFLTERDATQLTATVHNDTGKAQTAYVRLYPDLLQTEGETTRSVEVPAGGQAALTWRVTAPTAGEAHLKVTAWTPQVAGQTQWTDGLEESLPIAVLGRESISYHSGAIAPGKPATLTLPALAEARPEASRITIRYTPSAVTALAGAVDYLVGYPYGCVEQTMSRFVPDIMVQRILRLGGGSGVARRTSSTRELPRMVRDGLARLYRMQHESGGWGWWENDADDAWMTAYVLYGLALAKTEGYEVSADVIERGRAAAQRLYTSKAEIEAENKIKTNWHQAFLLCAIAMNGGGKFARTEREKLRLPQMETEDVANMVWLNHLLGEPGKAWTTAGAFEELDRLGVEGTATLHWRPYRHKKEGYYDEASDSITATAAGLRALLAHNRGDARAGKVMAWFMQRRTGDYWESTRDTTLVLLALCDYLQAWPPAPIPAGAGVAHRINGGTAIKTALDTVSGVDTVVRIPGTSLRTGRNEIELTAAGTTLPCYYIAEVHQTATPATLPPIVTNGLKVQREFLRVVPRRRGADDWRLQTEPTNNALKQGDFVRVRLTITAPENMSYVLVKDPFPAGCEVNERGTAGADSEWDYWWSSMDVRDDHIAFFARTMTKGKHVIEYNLRAQTPGTFHTLPALVQEMYAPDTRAETGSATVVIK